MITIKNEIQKRQENFWNQCLFHPTDAVEDSWGKRILDRIAADGAIKTVRIYSMLEDIVYTDENDNICYDFRISDLRLDYLLEKGYNLLIAEFDANNEIELKLTANCVYFVEVK